MFCCPRFLQNLKTSHSLTLVGPTYGHSLGKPSLITPIKTAPHPDPGIHPNSLPFSVVQITGAILFHCRVQFFYQTFCSMRSGSVFLLICVPTASISVSVVTWQFSVNTY